MKRKDLTLALLVVAVWGANFTVMKLGLTDMPPMLLAVLRFTLVAASGIWFVKRPCVSWRYVAAYGLTVGAGQFSCLFYAIKTGMPAGLSSVVLQSQAAFTVLFASLILKERVRLTQLVGIAVAAVGLVLIGVNSAAGAGIPIKAFCFTVLAAAFWACSNVVLKCASRKAQEQGQTLNVMSMVVWSSLVPPIPLLLLALLMDSPQTLLHALQGINGQTIFALCYLSFGATMFGYGLWGRLISAYPATKVAPLSLLVPVSGLLTARLVLGEAMSPVQWLGGGIILAALVISSLQLPLKPQPESVSSGASAAD